MRKLSAILDWLLDRERVTISLEEVMNGRGWRVRKLIYIKCENSRRFV